MNCGLRIADCRSHARVMCLSIIVLLAGSLAMAQAAPAKVKTPTDLAIEAQGHSAHSRFDEAVVCYQAVVADATATPAQKRQALEAVINIHRRHKKDVPKAIAALDQYIKLMAADPQAVFDASVAQADTYWEENKKNEAIAKLRQYVQANAAQRKFCCVAEVKLVGWLWTLQNWQEAYAEAAKVIDFDASDDKLVAATFAQMGEAAALFKDDEKCLAAYRRMLEPKYAALRTPPELGQASNRIIDILTRLKRNEELLAHYRAFMAVTPEMPVKQDMAMRLANTLLADPNRQAEALAAYELVFTESYGISDRWYEAQCHIVEILRKLNRLPEALQAARICLDAAPDAGNVQNWTAAIADIMREIDNKDVTRANQFVAYEMYGPAGKDQTPGTPDDVANPLAAVAYPSYPAREQAFVKARSAAGDSARASRHRAMTYVFSGKPAESLKYFADAFRRCGGSDMRVMATEMVAIGVRGVQGHPINLDRCYQFMLLGPAGPDGKVGTPDDVLDPFGAMGVAAPAPATGGLAEMPPDQAKQLKDLMPRLEDMAEYWRQHYGRREAVAAVTRAHVALCDWADPKARDWYIREMLLSTQEYQTILMDGALGAAKGGQLHLVGVRQFHADLDAAAEAAGIKMPEWPRGRDVVKGVVDQLTKPQDLRPKLSPLPPPPPPPKK